MVDASALTNALLDDGPVGVACRAELARSRRWAAPEHLGVEAFSAIRGRVLGGRVEEPRAEEAIDALRTARIDVIATGVLLRRMWALRHTVTGYDAAYVASAEALRCPLVTADRRLGRATGVACEIRVVPTELV